MLQETLADLTLPAYSYRVPLVMTIWEQKGREVELTLIEVVLVGGGGWYMCMCGFGFGSLTLQTQIDNRSLTL